MAVIRQGVDQRRPDPGVVLHYQKSRHVHHGSALPARRSAGHPGETCPLSPALAVQRGTMWDMTPRWMPLAAWAAVTAGAAGVGLASVGAVRQVVADEPVQVLSAADVDRILAQPDLELDPLPTLAAATSVPLDPTASASATASSRAVGGEGTRAGGPAVATRRGATNADDRPSGLSGDPRPLSDAAGGLLGANGTNEEGTVTSPSGSPAPSPTPSPTGTPSGSPSPSQTPGPSGSPTDPPSPDGTPTDPASPSASPSPTPSPGATGSPSPTPSPDPTPAPTSTVSPSASPTGSAAPSPTTTPAPSASSTLVPPPSAVP
jgi:hypothetical protein